MDSTTTTVVLTGSFTLGGVLLTSLVALVTSLISRKDRRQEMMILKEHENADRLRGERLVTYPEMLKTSGRLVAQAASVLYDVESGNLPATLPSDRRRVRDEDFDPILNAETPKLLAYLLADQELSSAMDEYHDALQELWERSLAGVRDYDLIEEIGKRHERVLIAMREELESHRPLRK